MFLVTGANGELFGRPVVEQLRRLVPADQIVAGTREPARASDIRASGVEVRRVDFDDEGSLAAAFAGMSAVLINGSNYGTATDRRGAQHAAAIRAAVKSGITRIVYTSWPDPELFTLPSMADFARSEALLRGLSADATILRTTLALAQTVGRDVTSAIARGALTAPAANARTTPAHIDDLAEATARVLVSGEHSRPLYTLTAADTIDWADLADLASTMSGKPIAYRAISDDQFHAELLTLGVPQTTAAILIGVYQAFRAGWTGTPTNELAEINRRAPKPAIEAVAAALTP